MKTTWYFDNRVIARRPYLREEWIDEAWNHPIYKETQPNGRTRHFIYITEYDKYLRVVFEGEMVHNAFFDRGFKPKGH